MIVYPNVTEQDLINFGRLAEKQNNYPATKNENRTLGKTLDKKLAESFEPMNQKIEEVNDTIQKLTKMLKRAESEIETSIPLAIECHQPQITTQNTRNDTHPQILYDKSPEKTIDNMKI